jgi:hypothetical protein
VSAPDICTCGSCGLSWDDSIATSCTPAPAGRCPFEQFHRKRPLFLRDIPRNFPVQPVLIGRREGVRS